MSKEDSEDHGHGKLPYNGYSDEFLDRLEPNGNIPAGKGDIRYGEFALVSFNDVIRNFYNQFNLFAPFPALRKAVRNLLSSLIASVQGTTPKICNNCKVQNYKKIRSWNGFFFTFLPK